ncbi:MAG: WxL protein peptidoglycan domain-containing protein [Thermomicrobiales bacterium]
MATPGLSSEHVLAQTAATPPSGTPVPGSAEAESFEVYPATGQWGDYFNLSMQPGETKTEKLLVANTGSGSQDVMIYATNAFTADGGGFGADLRGVDPNPVTSWITLPEVKVTLESGKGVEQSFKISIPQGTKPGQYITAVAAEEADSLDVKGGEAFAQKLRYVIPVFITVPGETTSGFTVGSVQITTMPEGLQVVIPLQNIGDVRVQPKGDIAILGEDSERIASIPVEMRSIYAHDQTNLTVTAPGNFPPGKYSVTVSLKDEETGTTAEGGVKDVQLAGTGTEAVQSPVTLGQSTIEPGPSADNVQFVTVNTVVSNSGDPIANGQLSLIAKKDGKEVERFPISQSLSVPTGDTPVSTRYIPAEGFTTGTWTFELLLETTDSSGAALVLAQQPIDGQVVIP